MNTIKSIIWNIAESIVIAWAMLGNVGAGNIVRFIVAIHALCIPLYLIALSSSEILNGMAKKQDSRPEWVSSLVWIFTISQISALVYFGWIWSAVIYCVAGILISAIKSKVGELRAIP